MNKGLYATLVSLLVVAGLLGTAVHTKSGGGKEKHVMLKTTRRTVMDLCKGTRYEDTCVQTLGVSSNVTSPGQYVKTGFMVMTFAMNDLEKSVNATGRLDNTKEINAFMEDLKVWMGGVLTYQETCFDAFEGAKDTQPGHKIRHFFNTSRQLTSNALSMLNQVQPLVSLIDIPSFGGLLGLHRRLLKSSDGEDSGDSKNVKNGLMPDWIRDAQRNLLTKPVTQIKPDAVVALDGSGQYKSVSAALAKNPNITTKPYIVYVKAGVYKETVTVGKKEHNVFLVGDGPTKTIITDSKNFVDGIPTYKTATVGILGDGFMARDIGFENSAGPEKHQAVAVRVVGDFAVFYNCQFDGFQDTLYSVRGRHFFRDCTVKGTIDFIFGDAQSIFQNCQLVIKKPMDNQRCAVTAQGRSDPNGPGGIVLQNCSIVGEPAYTPAVQATMKAFLGRPWKPYSRTIVMQSFIDSVIDAEGWEEWMGTKGINTLFYAEYQNRGPGSALDQRVTWPGIKKLSAGEIAAFTPDGFFKGSEWVPPTGAPFVPGMLTGV
ncbi:hypothetical protein V2J09_023231 [Rumex salicifolius]